MKKTNLLLATAAAALTSGMAVAQDECASAMAIATGATPFDTTAATVSAEPWNCASGAANDLWYTYTAAADFGISVDLCGSTYDTALEVYEGACGALVLVDCNDDFCGLQSGISFVPVAGTTYTIRVGGFSTNSGTGAINLSEQLTPYANEECSGAIPLEEGVIYSNVGATSSMPTWACGGGTQPGDIWFTYTPTNSGPFSINTCAAGTDFDTRLELFSGDCGSLNLLDCNDDMGGAACSFSGLRSEVSHCGTAGETYYVRAGGFTSATGNFEFVVNGAAGPDPMACVETIFATNNGGAVGGSVLFDATFLADTVIGSMATNTSVAAGTPITADVYVGAIGSEVLLGTATGTSAGIDNPSWLTFNPPIVFTAGMHDVTIHAVDYNHRYTNGAGGMNQQFTSPDGNITLDLGQGSNTFPPGGLFSPRIWNGILCPATDLGTPDTTCVATNNSTGAPGELVVGGSECVDSDVVTLTATSLPQNSFGYFLCSTTQGNATPAGSMGPICLAGDIGRGVGGAIQNSGSTGSMSVSSSLTLPHPSLGMVQVLAGESWNFQLWHRDSVGGAATSNTTNASQVTYQ